MSTAMHPTTRSAAQRVPHAGRRRRFSTKTLVGLIVVVAVAVAMIADTKFLSQDEVAKVNPPAFNAETYAKQAFPEVTEELKKQAVDITELAPAVEDDVEAAGTEYGQDLGSGSFAVPVKATGTAAEVDDDFILLEVVGVPAGTAVRVPLGAAITGTPVRDATGTIKFGDFAGQTDYQSVANQFKLRIQQDVIAQLDPVSVKGKQVTVYGAWATGGPPKSFIIQPVEIQVTA